MSELGICVIFTAECICNLAIHRAQGHSVLELPLCSLKIRNVADAYTWSQQSCKSEGKRRTYDLKSLAAAPEAFSSQCNFPWVWDIRREIILVQVCWKSVHDLTSLFSTHLHAANNTKLVLLNCWYALVWTLQTTLNILGVLWNDLIHDWWFLCVHVCVRVWGWSYWPPLFLQWQMNSHL